MSGAVRSQTMRKTRMIVTMEPRSPTEKSHRAVSQVWVNDGGHQPVRAITFRTAQMTLR